MKPNEQKEKIFQEFYKYIGMHHVENTASKAEKLVDNSKDIDFPEDLDLWFNEYTRNAEKYERKKKFNSKISLFTRRVAILLVVIALGSLVMTLSVDAYRVKIFNIFTDIKEKYTDINIEREPNNPIGSENLGKLHYYPGYLPRGYKQSDIQNHGRLWLVFFQNDNGDVIEFYQSDLDSDFQVDTEDANTSELYVNGADGILVSKGDVITLFWFTDTHNFYIRGKLKQNDILSMAESLEYIK